jgi:hypothetical protein
MRRWIALLLMSLPLSAIAAECDHWTASIGPDEDGDVMMASICAPAGDATHEILVRCAGPDSLWIRFIPTAPTGYPPTPDYNTKLEFSMDREKFTEPAQYEDMDGAMAMNPEINTPLVSALQSQKEVKVSDTTGKVPGATFTLKGARAALAKVIATCPSL